MTRVKFNYPVLLVAFCLSLVFLNPEDALSVNRIDITKFNTVKSLKQFYKNNEYTTETIQEGKYYLLSEFPHDFRTIPSASQKKKLFKLIVLPLVYLENDRILRERAEFKELLNNKPDSAAKNKRKIEENKSKFLNGLTKRYDISDSVKSYDAIESIADTLLRRVNTVPPSIVLAQAATESGWGTSRFALEANNIFGVRTYNDDAEGLQPKGIEGSADFKVRKYSTLLQSIRGYMRNLNTHQAYRKFRVLREKRGVSEGLRLVKGLKKYSERRGNYLDSIKNLIRYNDYSRYDQRN